MEDKDIEMLLNPILEESMKASLDTILEMKYQNLIEKGDIVLNRLILINYAYLLYHHNIQKHLLKIIL